jgi:3-oxoacyl-[acyl-carrier-protein] synthase-1
MSACILTTGARTPLGLKAAPSAAAVRAGISALSEHPFMVDSVGDPMPAAMDAQLDPALKGPARLMALAESALAEACAPLAAASTQHPLKLPLYVALPELRPGFTDRDSSEMRERLTAFRSSVVEITRISLVAGGHAAGLQVMAEAVQGIADGKFDACLVGGVDSYFEPDTMEWLQHNRQLTGTVSRSGFVPGEGAGFCLLTAASVARRLGLPPHARIVSAATGLERDLIKTTAVCLGLGLTEVVRRAVEAKGDADRKISDVICDVNGERYRGEEWTYVCLRLPEHFEDPTAYVSPADCWGDMGAASGPLFAMLACQAARRGYAHGPLSLLWASSEGGLRGAVLLNTEDE